MSVSDPLRQARDATEALSRSVVELGRQLGLRVACAESLTGGLLAAAIVDTPGASYVLNGGVVVYDSDLKRRLCGVDAALLAQHGPVHSEVAEQMARGVRSACAVTRHGELVRADIGVATTGVAGPDADPQTGQPPGTVFIGVSSERGDEVLRFAFSGDRAAIREATVRAALEALLGHLRHRFADRGGS